MIFPTGVGEIRTGINRYGVLLKTANTKRVRTSHLLSPSQAEAIARDLMDCAAKAREAEAKVK